jgi:hypothetical protein
VPVLKDITIPVPVNEVLRRLGTKKQMKISSRLARIVNEEIEISQDLIVPMGIYERFDVCLEKKDVVAIGDGLHVCSSDLYRWIKGCDEVVALVVTLGEGITERMEDLVNNGVVTRAMIVDAIGSETVEKVANAVTRIIRDTVRMATTKRYSPGYGDWDLWDQEALLNLVGADRIGIRVNENSIMIPEKSISAVIGLKGGARKP